MAGFDDSRNIIKESGATETDTDIFEGCQWHKEVSNRWFVRRKNRVATRMSIQVAMVPERREAQKQNVKKPKREQ